MALFTFISYGRKKPAIEQPVTEHMSKAHKILGSTPLSIDAPPCHRDDASSTVLSDDRSATTITSVDPDSEPSDLDDDHPVGIAKSDNGWGDESAVLPSPLRVDIEPGQDLDESSIILRNSRSSSTIKSWYDKSKLPLSISQQTSSSAMAKGPPIQPDMMLDFGSRAYKAVETHPHSETGTRKPAKLHLTSLMPGPRLMRKISQTQLGTSVSGTDSTVRSYKPMSMPSPITPTAQNFHQPQSPERCHRVSPTAAAARSEAGGRSGGSQWPRPNDALDALPTLYDHYEQMSMRHVMKQYSHPDLSRPKMEPRDARPVTNSEGESGRRSSKCVDWLDGALPPSPQTDLPTKPSTRASPTVPSAASVCSRQTRTSKTSKLTERNFASADLQKTSVLLLSSDSESDDDDADEVMYSPKSMHPAPSRRGAELPQLASSPLKSSKESSMSVDRSSCKSGKSGKRTSFALANTYITIPSDRNTRSSRSSPLDTPQDSRFLSPTIDTMYADDSRRASFASTYSASSIASAQSRISSYSIREARAVTLTSARHPYHQKRNVSDETRLRASDMNGSMRRGSFHAAADQLTPPLSPSSMDFYIRSARSSIDEPDNHSRLMAVSRQEELLLSALRQKHRAMRGNGFGDLHESDDVYGEDDKSGRGRRRSSLKRGANPSQRRGSSDGRSKAARTSFADLASMVSLDCPATSSANDSDSPDDRRRTSRTSRRWSAAAAVPGTESRQSRDSSREKHRDVPLILDETDPSPDLSDFRDWHAAMTTDKSSHVAPISRKNSVEDQLHRQRPSNAPVSLGKLHTQFRLDSFTRLTGVAEEGRGDADGEVDVPRPDSPISPDSFPAVPPERKIQSNLARLSAVGPGTLSGDCAP
ncbi:hypothetical protein HIM_05978 [Hirsutella minnesotensis 3608]|uniref:Uncharacterized protein n=1 Tax=Hirsutella minnesotensis 3608 TaxID=1043627 RepID=A0A0F7ZUC6_9HYPO|nr:hypothetical protein HIM_05978 [Hirsutella minnesotensis 3608]